MAEKECSCDTFCLKTVTALVMKRSIIGSKLDQKPMSALTNVTVLSTRQLIALQTEILEITKKTSILCSLHET